jgi:SRSO17 transposase
MLDIVPLSLQILQVGSLSHIQRKNQTQHTGLGGGSSQILYPRALLIQNSIHFFTSQCPHRLKQRASRSVGGSRWSRLRRHHNSNLTQPL